MFAFLLSKEKNANKKLIAESFGFGFFGPQMAVLWRTTVIQKNGLLKPLYL